jgi:hypothetical protein
VSDASGGALCCKESGLESLNAVSDIFKQTDALGERISKLGLDRLKIITSAEKLKKNLLPSDGFFHETKMIFGQYF